MPNIATGSGGAGDLDASLNTMITEFRLLSDEAAVCKSNATRQTLAQHSGRSKVMLNYGRFQAYDLTDGVDMVQAQSLADTQTVFTPNEVGAQTIVPDTTLRRVADTQLLQRVGQIMRNAYNLKEDADGTAQFSSWTPTMGGTTTVIGVGHCAAARARIRIGNSTANPEPFTGGTIVGILHPYVTHVLSQRMIPLADVPAGTNVYTPGTASTAATVGPAAGGLLGDDLIKRGPEALGLVGNVRIFEDANIAVTSTPSCVNAIFSKDGFIYVSEFEPQMRPQERDESLRGIELNVVGSYVFGLYRPGASGVALTTDVTAPTG